MIISNMLNLEFRTPNTDFRSKEEGRINPLIQLHHSLFVNRHSIFSSIVIILCASALGGVLGLPMTTFCNNMNISNMLNLEFRTPNTDFRSKEEGRINPLIQLHHSLFVNRHSIFSPIVIILCAPPFFSGELGLGMTEKRDIQEFALFSYLRLSAIVVDPNRASASQQPTPTANSLPPLNKKKQPDFSDCFSYHLNPY